MPKYKVKRYTTEVSFAEMEVEDDEPCPDCGQVHKPDSERLEEEAAEIDDCGWSHVLDYPTHRYEIEEIT